MKILISACLLGQPVRYDGRDNAARAAAISNTLRHWQQLGLLIPVCPEVAAGLPTPRPAAEIIAGSGADVLAGNATVKDLKGDDVSAAFIAGAEKTLATARTHHAVAALLAARSPSCGSDGIYNGDFSGTLTAGMGVTAALLEQHGIPCFSPQRFAELEQLIRTLRPDEDGV